MRYLTLKEVLDLHRAVIERWGGASEIRDFGMLESAVAQPQMTFAGEDLYPGLEDKACALGFSLIRNHPFVDGNKRAGYAAMETFLVMHGYEIETSVDDAEEIVLAVAAGTANRDHLLSWLKKHVRVR